MPGPRPSDEFLRELLVELEPRAFRGVKLSTELVTALVREVLEGRAAARDLEREAEALAPDIPPERRPTPPRPARRTSGPWARGAELRTESSDEPEDVDELDLTIPDGD